MKILVILLCLIPSLAFAVDTVVIRGPFDSAATGYTQTPLTNSTALATTAYADAAVAAKNSYAFVFSSPLQATMTDGQTVYWGELALVPTTTADAQRTYFARGGHIKSVVVYMHCGTAGSNENWSMYIRINNTTDTLIQTVGTADAQRTWVNAGLNIAVTGPTGNTAGDYLEIKEVQPTWGTNPANCKRNSVIYIE